MIDKTYEIKVKIGEYQKDGQTKGRYATIGRVMPSKDGHPFALLDSNYLSMQLNYLANKERKDSVICSMFEPYNANKQSAHYEAKSNGYQAEAVEAEIIDDEIPF